jgi:hypothetical protein
VSKKGSSILVLVTIWIVGACCCECPPSNDSVFIYFTDESGKAKYIPYRRVFGLGGNGNLRQERRDSLQQIMLPISLKTNQVTFVFEGNNRFDTLSFQYKVKPYYDQNCGYNVMLDSLKIISPSTFKKIQTEGDYAIKIVL